MYHWQPQTPNFYLKYHFTGHSSLALHITLPFCVSTTLSLSYNALRNAQSTCQTSESVNKVNPGSLRLAPINFNITKIELMHLVCDREGLLPESSAGYLELRRLKSKHTWQLTACLLQIINGSLPTGSTISITTVVKWSCVRTVRAMPKRHL